MTGTFHCPVDVGRTPRDLLSGHQTKLSLKAVVEQHTHKDLPPGSHFAKALSFSTLLINCYTESHANPLMSGSLYSLLRKNKP